MQCTICEKEMPHGKMKCPYCGTWNLANQTDENDESILLNKVKSAEHDRLDVGVWNYCWGGGIVRTSTTLLGGLPGAGKSTMLLQMADEFAKSMRDDQETLYIASEEDLPSIRARADRLGINQQHKIRMVPAMSGVANIGKILNHRKPGATIIDSIQGLFGKDDNDIIEALGVLKKISVSLNQPTIVISHVTKDGDYSGQMTFQHAVDVLMFLTPEQDEEDGPRILDVRKNRHGRAFIQSVFEMTEQGLILMEEDDE